MGATLVTNIGSFLFLLMIARSVDAAVLGASAALLFMLVVLEVPADALQVVLARNLRRGAADPQAVDAVTSRDIGSLLVDTVLWGAAAALGLGILAPLVERLLHLSGPLTAELLAADVIPVAVAIVPKSLLMGEDRHGVLALPLVVGTAVKLAVGILLVHNGYGVEGAMAAVVSGDLVAAALLLFHLRRHLRAGLERDRSRTPWRGSRLPAITFTGYWLLNSLDVVLARYFFPGAASGDYAAAAITAQLALILPAAVSAWVFPHLTQRDSRRARLTLATASASVGFVGLVTATLLGSAAHPVVRLLFGGGYPASASIVGILTAAGAVLGVITILVQYHAAQAVRPPAALPWLGVAVLVCGSVAFHRTILQLAVVTLTAEAAVAIGMVAIAIGRIRVPDDVMAAARVALEEATIDLTVVVPYYNPGHLLRPNVERLLDVLDRSDSSYEVITVSDGSTDGSESTLDDLQHDHLLNVVLPRNLGKGAALRLGLARGRGRWLGFLDADGDLDPSLLEPFQALVRLYDPEIVLGSKRHPLSEVEYPRRRRLYSFGYQQLSRILFGLSVRDTQTGLKIIRRDVLTAALPRMLEKRFAFDLELFVIARRLGYKRFLEAPVRLHHQFASTVSWRSVVRTLQDTVAIFVRLRILHWYDSAPVERSVPTTPVRVEGIVRRGGTTARWQISAPGTGSPLEAAAPNR